MLGRSVRTSQPQGPARVDWGNPITRGLVLAINPASGLINLVSNARLTCETSLNQILNSSGKSFKFDSAVNSRINTGYTNSNISGHTAIVFVRHPSISGGGGEFLSSAVTSQTGWGFYKQGNAGSAPNQTLRLGYVNYGVADYNSTISVTKVNTNVVPLAFSCRLNQSLSFFAYGEKLESFSVTGINQNSQELGIGRNVFFNASKGDYDLNVTLYFNRALSDAEIKSLSDNPWQIFAPDSKALWTPAAVSVTLPTLVQPNSTTSAGAWTATGAASLHEAINELVPSDTQYISVNSASTTELLLAEAAYPGASNQTLAYWASSTQGSTLTVTLKQGATQIMTRTHALTSTDTLYTQTLTAPEIALITAGAISVTLTTS